jgi:hypothetical protein
MTAILRHLQQDPSRRRISMADLDIYINFFPEIFSTQYRHRTEFILNANGLGLKMDPRLKFAPGDLIKMFNPYYIPSMSGLAVTTEEELRRKKKKRGRSKTKGENDITSASITAADSDASACSSAIGGSSAVRQAGKFDSATGSAVDSGKASLDPQEIPASTAEPAAASKSSSSPARRISPAGSKRPSPARSVQGTPPRSRQSSSSQLVPQQPHAR